MEEDAGAAATERHIKTLFSQIEGLEGDVCVASLVHEWARGGPGFEHHQHLFTRDRTAIQRHRLRWGAPGRGIYVCVAVLKKGSRKRRKEDVAYLVCCHTDVDLKDLLQKRDEVLRVLRELGLRPTMIVDSGHGFHCYWVFRVPLGPGYMEMVESANRELARVLGADSVSVDCTRVLRLAGSVNSKEAGKHVVARVLESNDVLYSLTDVLDWAKGQGELLTRHVVDAGQPQRPLGTNPYLDVAQRLGQLGPAVDVDGRLNAMVYQGGGESSVHATQLSVTASLVARGVPIEEVVERVLEATQAAAPVNERWDWAAEERAIRGMCMTALEKWPLEKWPLEKWPSEKFPPKQIYEDDGGEDNGAASEGEGDADEEVDQKVVLGGGGVVDLAEARKKARGGHKATSETKVAIHQVLAEGIVQALKDRRQDLLFVEGAAWRFDGAIWAPADWKTQGPVEVHLACKSLGVQVKRNVVSETLAFLDSIPELHVGLQKGHVWDSHGFLPFRNCLVDPANGFEVHEYAPSMYATWRLEAEWDPLAKCPLWEQMLDDMFEPYDKDEAIEHVACLQEWMGCRIVSRLDDRKYKYALGLVGRGWSGKTEVADVMQALVGEDACVAIPFSTLEGHHLESLLGARALIVNEAVDGKGSVAASVFKALVTGEKLQINPKGKKVVQFKSDLPVAFTANMLPVSMGADPAFAERMIVFDCPARFTGDEGVAVVARRAGYGSPAKMVIATELAGVAQWALEGMRRALTWGTINVPARSIRARREVTESGNSTALFARDMLVFGRGEHFVHRDVVNALRRHWYQQNDYNLGYLPSAVKFWQQIRALDGANHVLIPPLEVTKTDSGAGIAMGVWFTDSAIAQIHYLRDWTDVFKNKDGLTKPNKEKDIVEARRIWRACDLTLKELP